jgi:hypothetical protein
MLYKQFENKNVKHMLCMSEMHLKNMAAKNLYLIKTYGKQRTKKI